MRIEAAPPYDDRIRETGVGFVVGRELSKGTRAVLMSDELMDILAKLADGSATVTWEWGEPDEYGFYTPTFTRHEETA